MSDTELVPDDPGKPIIEISIPRAVCGLHGEVFRADWPKGWPIFVLSLLQAIIELDSFQEATGGDADRFGEVLDRKPACEWFSADKLKQLYIDCKVGVTGQCENCRQTALGTPYQITVGRRIREYRHICFDCVLYRLKPVH